MHSTETRASDSDIWSLKDVERLSVAQQAAAGISSLCFFNGFQVSDAVGQQVAKELEAKAYDRATVEAATTTGSRPRYEPLGSTSCTDFQNKNIWSAAWSSQSIAKSRWACRKEVERAYFRILSQQVVESARDGCASFANREHATAAIGDVLDLSSSGREFLTRDLAQQVLDPMLRGGIVLLGAV